MNKSAHFGIYLMIIFKDLFKYDDIEKKIDD